MNCYDWVNGCFKETNRLYLAGCRKAVSGSPKKSQMSKVQSTVRVFDRFRGKSGSYPRATLIL